MKTALLVVAFAVVGCGSRTAYTSDHGKSYLCIPNPQVQHVPFGEPLAVAPEKGEKAAAVAAK